MNSQGSQGKEDGNSAGQLAQLVGESSRAPKGSGFESLSEHITEVVEISVDYSVLQLMIHIEFSII